MKRLPLAAAGCLAAFAAALATPQAGAAGGPVRSLGKTVRITTPGATNCPAEGEPDTVTTSAGTWVGYNDDHDCLYPVVSKLERLTGVQLVPAKGGAPRLVKLAPKAGEYFSGDPALTEDPAVPGGVILATLYAHTDGRVTIETFRIAPSLRVSPMPTPALAPGGSDDKEFIASDTGRHSRYRGRVYLAWDDFAKPGLIFRAFTGRSWGEPVVISPNGGKPDVAVAPNGDVAVAYEVTQGVAVRISHNGGKTFGDAEIAIAGAEPGRSDPSCPLRPVVGTRQRATKAVRAVYDPLGRLHVVAALGPSAGLPRAGVALGGDSQVLHAVLVNGEFAAAPVGETDKVRFHPAVAVTPSGGVAVAWLEVADAQSLTYDAYLAVAARGSARFSDPVRLSTAAATFPSAMEAMANSNCYGIGDYIGLASTPRGVVAAWPTTDSSTKAQVDSDVLLREAVLR
jgi:hypothetical protein